MDTTAGNGAIGIVEDYDFSKAKTNALTLPRDKAWSNWAKFEKEGDSVGGFIRDVFYRKGEGEFKEQRGITLEQPNGELINVGIKRISFILAKTDNLRLGDPLTIEFEKELPPRQKGYKGVKQFSFYGKNLPQNAGNKTVAELENEDKARSQGADQEAEKELDELAKETAEAIK